MSGLDFPQQAYQKLVQIAPTFSPEESSPGLKEFMSFARQYALGETHEDAEVMEFLSAANRQADWGPLENLAQRWIPHTFDERIAEVLWCLPQGRAVQPFYDEYITHCRQHLVNALVAPRSSIKSLLHYAEQLPQVVEPSGFIFHVSRCGSTLVSGCLAQLEHCSVLSESPLLTEILLAENLDRDCKKRLLQTCLHLQSRRSIEQPHVIVKWNAWDIFYLELIREIWPQVPVLLLARNPLEVLASHTRSVGRHMSGDPSLSHILGSSDCTSLLAFRIRVLQGLMTEMLKVRNDSGIALLDYTELNISTLIEICAHFGIAVDPHQHMQLRRRLMLNSKEPATTFRADSEEKRRNLSEAEVVQINRKLASLYFRLIQNPY